jgi:spore coat polysaccharide biosynthesis protein SpsF
MTEMNRKYKTEQESFWAGEFGTEYIKRNASDKLIASNIALFSKALAHAHSLNSCVEFGANIGLNLRALKALYPNQEQWAVEINQTAADELATVIPTENVYRTSILDFFPPRTWDIALIKGVLIHIGPNRLATVYNALHQAARRYVCLVEYYNPTPIEVTYRGHAGKLFKRDFAGEMLDKYPDLRLVDYGFVYHRDPNFPQDDLTWFLLEKSGE